MGIYAINIQETPISLYQKILKIFPGEIFNVEIWTGYPLVNLGKLVVSYDRIPENLDIPEDDQDIVVLVEGEYQLNPGEQKSIGNNIESLMMEVYINLSNSMKDKNPLSWDIIYPQNIDEKNILNLDVVKTIFYDIWDKVDTGLATIGYTDDCTNIKWEIPLTIAINHDRENLSPILENIIIDEWKLYDKLEINLPQLVPKFFSKAKNLFFEISNKIATLMQGVTATTGRSTILSFNTEEDWEEYKKFFQSVIDPMFSGMPQEDYYFDKWEKAITKKIDLIDKEED